MTAPQSPASAPRPFATAPDPGRYYPASAIDEARQRIGRSILRNEGPALVIGAPGLGKTMLLEVVAQQFRDQLNSVLLAGGQLCTRRALYQMILFQLGQPYKGMDESELRLALLSYLQPEQSVAQRILLLVDEADALPPRLLEELRSLTNLSAGGQLLVNLVLAGTSTLEEHFAEPKLELFSQRISARCYLTAFGREETFHFVRAQVAATGNDPNSLFTDDGLEAIFAATDGAPRLINQLGDQLMWMVAETGYSPLDSSIVQQAWSEIQQLPTPWNTQPDQPSGGAVEFGELPTDDGEIDAAVFPEAVVFEDESFVDSYDTEYDDDQPASIPIHTSHPVVDASPTFDISDSESIDVTEQLLDQLNALDSASEEVVAEATSMPEAHNPFQETFESEEIVLDQYSTFESLLLAEAPRVVNRTDSAFAQQLQQLETVESSPTKPAAEQTEQERASVPAEEPATTPCSGDPGSDVPGSDSPGDVLVIEDTEQPQAAVVEGQKFRQLFSSLESADGETCFG